MFEFIEAIMYRPDRIEEYTVNLGKLSLMEISHLDATIDTAPCCVTSVGGIERTHYDPGGRRKHAEHSDLMFLLHAQSNDRERGELSTKNSPRHTDLLPSQ